MAKDDQPDDSRGRAQAQQQAAQQAEQQRANQERTQGQAHAPGQAEEDDPGKIMEPAAPAGAQAEVPPGLSPPGQGAQVILTGDAQAAARGGTHGEILMNTMARDEAIAAGHVVEGTTAAAAADATTGGGDEIDDQEAADIQAAMAKARQARIARAAKKPA